MSLKDDILNGESHELEFKLVPNENPRKYLKTAVAFANGHGGRIVFGVDNSRNIAGLPHTDIFSCMDMITNIVVDSCVPRIPFEIYVEHCDNTPLIVMEVLPGSQCPYYLKKDGPSEGVFIRIGSTTRQADDATRNELAMETSGRSFDREACPNAVIDDKKISVLCRTMRRISKMNSALSANIKSIKPVSPEQLLSWGIIQRKREEWLATNAYALLDGNKAFSTRMKCAVFKGNSKAIFIDRREFTGSIIKQIEEAYSYILSKINLGCVFNGILRNDRYELPPEAIREIVINAYVHRCYFDCEAPVFVALYDDRLEITSPGGLPRGVTPERALNGYSRTRNKALARAFNYMNFIEEWGSGLPRINMLLNQYGLKPLSFINNGTDVQCILWRATSSVDNKKVSPEGEKVSPEGEKVSPKGEKVSPEGEKVSHKGEKVSPSTGNSVFLRILANIHLTKPTKQNICILFSKYGFNESFTRHKIENELKLSRTGAGKLLAKMNKLALIEPISGPGMGNYSFKKK